ncbi:MAG TPA: hydroxyacid dehydrogenase, partial [Oceanithermus sp.]|nr:hydroxyacid dehydrogenase [Oceanithermus sp.]
GMSFAFFFLAEFVELFLLPGFMVLLFFGGWHGPLFGLDPTSFAAGLLQSFYFLVKVAVWVWIFLWIRATLPRFRDDQLMDLAWKGLLPLSLVGLLVAALFRMFLEVL